MSQKRGNSTRYDSASTDRRWWQINDKGIPDELLASAWKRKRQIDPFDIAATRATNAELNDTVSGRDVDAIFGILAEVLGDEAFRTAQLALRAYGLNEGGIKQGLRQLVGSVANPRPLAAAMAQIDGWTRSGFSVNAAAKRVAAQLGTPGASFEAAVKTLKTAHAAWKISIEQNSPPPAWPDGNTGRRLRVRLHRGETGTAPHSPYFGVMFDPEGDGIAPDNQAWRRLIAMGAVLFCGFVGIE